MDPYRLWTLDQYFSLISRISRRIVSYTQKFVRVNLLCSFSLGNCWRSAFNYAYRFLRFRKPIFKARMVRIIFREYILLKVLVKYSNWQHWKFSYDKVKKSLLRKSTSTLWNQRCMHISRVQALYFRMLTRPKFLSNGIFLLLITKNKHWTTWV